MSPIYFARTANPDCRPGNWHWSLSCSFEKTFQIAKRLRPCEDASTGNTPLNTDNAMNVANTLSDKETETGRFISRLRP